MQKRGFMTVLIVLCGFLVLHVDRPEGGSGEVLRGSALELVDAKGIVRAPINVETQGDVVLRLRDESPGPPIAILLPNGYLLKSTQNSFLSDYSPARPQRIPGA